MGRRDNVAGRALKMKQTEKKKKRMNEIYLASCLFYLAFSCKRLVFFFHHAFHARKNISLFLP